MTNYTSCTSDGELSTFYHYLLGLENFLRTVHEKDAQELRNMRKELKLSLSEAAYELGESISFVKKLEKSERVPDVLDYKMALLKYKNLLNK